MQKQLTIPQALFLLAREDESGKPLGHYNMYIQPAGAITELVMMERLELTDDKWPKLNILSTAPTGSPYLDAVLERIAASARSRTMQHWVGSLAHMKNRKHMIGEELVKKGLVEERSGKVWRVQTSYTQGAYQKTCQSRLGNRYRRQKKHRSYSGSHCRNKCHYSFISDLKRPAAYEENAFDLLSDDLIHGENINRRISIRMDRFPVDCDIANLGTVIHDAAKPRRLKAGRVHLADRRKAFSHHILIGQIYQHRIGVKERQIGLHILRIISHQLRISDHSLRH